jgi:hypothetical protein
LHAYLYAVRCYKDSSRNFWGLIPPLFNGGDQGPFSENFKCFELKDRILFRCWPIEEQAWILVDYSKFLIYLFRSKFLWSFPTDWKPIFRCKLFLVDLLLPPPSSSSEVDLVHRKSLVKKIWMLTILACGSLTECHSS